MKFSSKEKKDPVYLNKALKKPTYRKINQTTLSNTQPLRTLSQSNTPNVESNLQQNFNRQLRSLIADNRQYFQNQIKVCCSNKPNNLKLKIPYKTPTTIYGKEFLKRNTSENVLPKPFSPKAKTKVQFQGTSTYQNSYVGHDVKPRQKTPLKIIDENQAPNFMNTQYRNQFLNWGGKNYCPSMKPLGIPAITEIPFQGSSVYKADFNKKQIQHNPKFERECSFPKFSDIQMTNGSNYTQDFTHKELIKDKSCKPENKYIDNGLKLNGQSQYRNKFDHKTQVDHCSWKKQSLEQLQDYIMNL